MFLNAGEDLLSVSTEDGIARIVVNRPEARNAFTIPMYQRLKMLCETLNADDTIKAVILTGAGDKAFSSGTDISHFQNFNSPQHALDYEIFMESVLQTIEALRVPTIAALAGSCTGGGAAIAACCDFRVSMRNLKFGFPMARTLGNCLSAANLARVSRLIGASQVKDILFTARLIEADEAIRIGFLNAVVESRDDLDLHCLGLARQIASNAPLTLRATKEALYRLEHQGSSVSDDDLITMCYSSHDFKEGMTAFLAKRSPRWEGR